MGARWRHPCRQRLVQWEHFLPYLVSIEPKLPIQFIVLTNNQLLAAHQNPAGDLAQGDGIGGGNHPLQVHLVTGLAVEAGGE